MKVRLGDYIQEYSVKNKDDERNMYMEIRNSKTEMPLFKVKGEKFIFVGEI